MRDGVFYRSEARPDGHRLSSCFSPLGIRWPTRTNSGVFSSALAGTIGGPQSTGSGSLTHKGMWSLTLCSNLAVKLDLSADESSR